MKTFKAYLLQREEYNKTFEFIGMDENDEPIIKETLVYTGIKTNFIHHNKTELLNANSIPEWKAAIIDTFIACNGHVIGGNHKYDIHRNPITIFN